MPQKSRLNLRPLKLGKQSQGARLQRLRKEKGYTQVELAEKIGLTQNLISAYECDRLRLSAEMVVRFAQALLVSADELLGLAQAAAPKEKQPSRRVLRRLQRIEALSKRDQEALLRTIDAFLSKTRTA